MEAVYEFFVDLTAPTDWHQESPSRMLAHFPELSGREERLETREFVVDVHAKVEPGFTPRASAIQTRIRRWNSDGTRAVQCGSHMCAYNVLPPYGHFEHHLPMQTELVRAYLEEAKPQRMAWAGQRAINIIRLPVSGRAAEYFEIYPKLPERLARDHRPLAVQVQTAEFENGTSVVNLGLRGIEGDQAVYVLDVYARSSGAMPADVDKLIQWQQTAHSALSDSFELSITDLSRHLFGDAT